MCYNKRTKTRAEARKGDKKMKGKRVFRFDLIDYYDGETELIYSSDDMAKIKKAALQRIKETDGECALVVADWDDHSIKDL